MTTDQFPTLRSFDFADVGQSKSYLEIICFTSEDGLFHKEYFTVDECLYKPTQQMKIITDSASGNLIPFLSFFFCIMVEYI